MKLLSSLLKSLFGPALPRVPTLKANCRKTRAIWLLVRQGQITLREISVMGENSPAKMVMEMRRDGVLFADAADPKGFRWEKNSKGPGKHKVYLWTNKLPSSLERRSEPRGAK